MVSKRCIICKKIKEKNKFKRKNKCIVCCKKNTEKSRLDMDRQYEIARKLHEKCIEDRCYEMPDPVVWIANQDNMRSMYENFKRVSSRCDHPFLEGIKNNSVTRYMDFMYNTYPAGYGNELMCRFFIENL